MRLWFLGGVIRVYVCWLPLNMYHGSPKQKDSTNHMVSGIPLILGLRPRMWDPTVFEVFAAPSLWEAPSSHKTALALSLSLFVWGGGDSFRRIGRLLPK